ncbi:hypothetical protein L249_2845 [Ophiocordyceps polyrhachis-furcata BCC 54312]|uniref:Uncharacterized protein n=1 Tax=Ophiocordyceps polyrhachis-furcata BCC 54312 TaxID=1330021 RepID=A0A367LPN7_9HYPO|nr:hypothetical protein L249_2845 [Ophiocordyceps polyrhachis-furcata BCC 54312]
MYIHPQYWIQNIVNHERIRSVLVRPSFSYLPSSSGGDVALDRPHNSVVEQNLDRKIPITDLSIVLDGRDGSTKLALARRAEIFASDPQSPRCSDCWSATALMIQRGIFDSICTGCTCLTSNPSSSQGDGNVTLDYDGEKCVEDGWAEGESRLGYGSRPQAAPSRATHLTLPI